LNFSEDKKSRAKLFVDIGVLVLSLVGISIFDVQKESSAFESFMVDTLAPVQKSLLLTKNEISSFVDHYFLNVEATKKNLLLTKEVGDLKKNLFDLQEMSIENKRLKELLSFGDQVKMEKVLAQVVAWDTSSDYRAVRINKGLADGIKLEAPVVTARGLVGYVYRITQHYSDILTVIDPNNRVDSIVQRTRTHGIVEGREEQCFMKYVTRTEPIILDDIVVTSGLSSIYPKGIVIGRVTRIERESYGIAQNVVIEPAVDFGSLEDVVVLINPQESLKKMEWDALDSSDEDGK